MITDLEKYQCKFIYLISFFLLLTSIIKLYQNQSFIALQTFLIFTTSQFYWRHGKKKSIERKIDMTVVNIIIIFNLTYCIYNKCNNIYVIIQLIAICFYPLSQYFNNINKMWIATYLHSSLHILSNIAVLFLIY